MAGTVAFPSARGVPVMGHVGLTPQAVNALGGYRSRGHAPGERDKIMRDGVAIAEAGAFSLVIEGVAESLARELTAAVAVPTIGIGGSPACDGQILVIDDMLSREDAARIHLPLHPSPAQIAQGPVVCRLAAGGKRIGLPPLKGPAFRA